MKLYSYFRSSAAYRVRIALNWKRLPYEYAAKHFRRGGGEHRMPEYLAINPQGLIPALEHGDLRIPQSLAIIEYLEEAFPETPRLLPERTAERALVRAMSLAIACDIHPLNNLRVLSYLKHTLGQSQEAIDTWYRHWVTEGFGALEDWIRKHSHDGEHSFGSAITLADVCLVPQVYNARRLQTDLAPYPAIVQVSEALERRPEFAAARPEEQPDAE